MQQPRRPRPDCRNRPFGRRGAPARSTESRSCRRWVIPLSMMIVGETATSCWPGMRQPALLHVRVEGQPSRGSRWCRTTPRNDSLPSTAIRARGLLVSRCSQMRTVLVRLTARLRAVSAKSAVPRCVFGHTAVPPPARNGRGRPGSRSRRTRRRDRADGRRSRRDRCATTSLVRDQVEQPLDDRRPRAGDGRDVMAAPAARRLGGELRSVASAGGTPRPRAAGAA